MRVKPYVIVRSAVSLDGCLDDVSPIRLILSDAEDLWQRDVMRAECDAIMVGAGTLRSDNPKLGIHCNENRQRRMRKGLDPDPIRVTLTGSGNLKADWRFFQERGEKIVYCAPETMLHLQSLFPETAGVLVRAYPEPHSTPDFILNDLAQHGVRRLLIEGGSGLNTLFLSREGLVDEVVLSIAPFFVGDAGAPRFVSPGRFPDTRDDPLELVAVEKVGTMAVVRYVRRGIKDSEEAEER